MSELTPNLKLFKYDPVADAKQPLDITKAWNNNWDILDKNTGGVPIGMIYPAILGIDESENKYRYLNGQIIVQEQFINFTNWLKSKLKTASNMFTTEQNWQAEKTASKLGQCGKFVIDDTAGTIRLPLVININGLTDLANCGVLKDESLPNVTGHIQNVGVQYDNLSYSGAFKNSVDLGRPTNWAMYDPNVNWAKLVNVQFSASSSSATYQDNAPVQQETIQYPYVIVVNTGVEEAERPINNYQVNNVYSYGMSTYYKGTMSNSSWLRSSGQWNKGTVYNGVYEWAVAQQVAGADGFKKSTDSDITDYDWVVNTEEQTFRLPLKNGQESVFDNDTVPSGYNLYYYIGDVLQNADLINIARLGEQLVDLQVRPHIEEVYVNGTSGYRIWSKDSTGYRYCEQWGQVQKQANPTVVTLLKSYKDTSYYVTNSFLKSSWNKYEKAAYIEKEESQINIYMGSYGQDIQNTDVTDISWSASGYIAD